MIMFENISKEIVRKVNILPWRFAQDVYITLETDLNSFVNVNEIC